MDTIYLPIGAGNSGSLLPNHFHEHVSDTEEGEENGSGEKNQMMTNEGKRIRAQSQGWQPIGEIQFCRVPVTLSPWDHLPEFSFFPR
jgi:hypothetical protein